MELLFYDDDVEARLAAAPLSLFRAGPTARGVSRTPWRSRALELLARDPARLALGMPHDALAGGHIRHHAHAAGVRIFDTLEETVRAAARPNDPTESPAWR